MRKIVITSFLLFVMLTKGYTLSWPVLEDTTDKITTTFGEVRSSTRSGNGLRMHKGIDIGSGANDEIRPVAEGTVVYIKNSLSGAYGRYIIIKHSENLYSLYAHLARISENININTSVSKDTIIGREGGSGFNNEDYYDPHLHLEIGDKYDKNKHQIVHQLNPLTHGLELPEAYKDKYEPEIRKPKNISTFRNNRLVVIVAGKDGRFGDENDKATSAGDNICPTIWRQKNGKLIFGKARLIVRGMDIVDDTGYPSNIYDFKMKIYRKTGGKTINVYETGYNFDSFTPFSGEVWKYYNTAKYVGTGSVSTKVNGGRCNREAYYYRNWDTLVAKGGGGKAKYNSVARYPDGEYKINIRLGDVEATHSDNYGRRNNSAGPPDMDFIRIVDNFVPYIKEIEIVDANNVNKLLFKARWRYDRLRNPVRPLYHDLVMEMNQETVKTLNRVKNVWGRGNTLLILYRSELILYNIQKN